MTATVQQIIDAYTQQAGLDRVHRQPQVPFVGQPGHYYFITGPRRPTSGDLAQITHQSQRAEAALFQIENCYCVYVGNPGDGPYAGTATFVIPHQGGPIEHFLWISHTHPLDAATSDTAMASGATGS